MLPTAVVRRLPSPGSPQTVGGPSCTHASRHVREVSAAHQLQRPCLTRQEERHLVVTRPKQVVDQQAVQLRVAVQRRRAAAARGRVEDGGRRKGLARGGGFQRATRTSHFARRLCCSLRCSARRARGTGAMPRSRSRGTPAPAAPAAAPPAPATRLRLVRCRQRRCAARRAPPPPRLPGASCTPSPRRAAVPWARAGWTSPCDTCAVRRRRLLLSKNGSVDASEATTPRRTTPHRARCSHVRADNYSCPTAAPPEAGNHSGRWRKRRQPRDLQARSRIS